MLPHYLKPDLPVCPIGFYLENMCAGVEGSIMPRDGEHQPSGPLYLDLVTQVQVTCPSSLILLHTFVGCFPPWLEYAHSQSLRMTLACLDGG